MTESLWSDGGSAALAAATGVLPRSDPTTRAAFADDFGHLVQAEPWAVVSPRTIDELASIVEFAGRQKLPLCARARGYSQSGQSLSPRGLSLDLTRLDHIERIDGESGQAQCESGVRWRELTRATLEHGLLPVVLPLNLDISVGGLLSAGGIGANSHRFGPAINQVSEVEVVTSGGQRTRCSRTAEPDLFSAVLAGLGRCGIISRAFVKLRPAPARVRTFHLMYGDTATWFADQQRLVSDRRAQYIEAMCWMSAKGFRGSARSRTHWLYGIQIGFEYDGQGPEPRGALAGLSPWRLVHVDDEDVAQFVARYQPRFDGMVQSGSWQQAHPWLECLVPPTALARLLPAILDELPMSLGDGHRLLWIDMQETPLCFAAPDGGHAVCFAILPTGVSKTERDGVLGALARVDRLLRDAGGKRYLSGWLGQMDEGRWREHHGRAYDAWIALKHRFDPDRIFRSALFPAG